MALRSLQRPCMLESCPDTGLDVVVLEYMLPGSLWTLHMWWWQWHNMMARMTQRLLCHNVQFKLSFHIFNCTLFHFKLVKWWFISLSNYSELHNYGDFNTFILQYNHFKSAIHQTVLYHYKFYSHLNIYWVLQYINFWSGLQHSSNMILNIWKMKKNIKQGPDIS